MSTQSIKVRQLPVPIAAMPLPRYYSDEGLEIADRALAAQEQLPATLPVHYANRHAIRRMRDSIQREKGRRKFEAMVAVVDQAQALISPGLRQILEARGET